MKKFTVITKDGSKWLRPVNPHEKHLVDEFGLFRNPDHVTFGLNNPDILYVGSHPEGTTLYESEVREIRQYQTTEFGSLTWYMADDEDEINRWRERNPDGFKTRTAYTDAEPQCPECGKYCSCPEEDLYDAVADYRINHPEPSHDRQVSEDYWRKRCESAERYINESPCDPDITKAQWVAYEAWREIVNQQPKK